MTATELDQVEQQLAVRFPSDFRAVLLATDRKDYDPLSAVGLVAMNQRYRKGGILNNVNDEPWPAHFIRISGDGTGHVSWFVRCDLDPSGVWECDHDAIDGIVKATDDVADFVKDMLWE